MAAKRYLHVGYGSIFTAITSKPLSYTCKILHQINHEHAHKFVLITKMATIIDLQLAQYYRVLFTSRTASA